MFEKVTGDRIMKELDEGYYAESLCKVDYNGKSYVGIIRIPCKEAIIDDIITEEKKGTEISISVRKLGL